MARQFIYHMQGMSKSYSGGKKVLEDVHLSFLPGRQDRRRGRQRLRASPPCCASWRVWTRTFSGEAWQADGAASGYLPQEPKLDETQDVTWQRDGRRVGQAGQA